MEPQNLTTDVAPLLGLESLSELEQADFLAQLGELIIESAVLRLTETLSNDQQVAINYYLDTKPAPEVFMQYLLTHHANFKTILEEEIASFRAECISVMGKGAMREADSVQSVAMQSV
jgi:hypothetical protein